MKLERLLHAYEIIDGIPKHKFDLAGVIHASEDATLECGTIACAAGWISLHPDFRNIVKATPGGSCGRLRWMGWILEDESGFRVRTDNYSEAMAYLFDISRLDADRIFGTRTREKRQYDPPKTDKLEMSDKSLWKYRVRAFLKRQGKL